MTKKPRHINWILVIGIVVVGFILYRTFVSAPTNGPKYSQIVARFENNEVSEFVFDAGNGTLEYTLRSDAKLSEEMIAAQKNASQSNSLFAPKPKENEETENKKGITLKYKMAFSNFFVQSVPEYIESYNTEYPKEPMKYDLKYSGDGSLWMYLVIITCLVGGLGLLFYYLMYMQGEGGGKGALGVSKAKVKSLADSKIKNTFADVAGADEEKGELEEIVEFLKTPGKFDRLGAKIPTGVLLVGPPGTGKTLLARACAGEAGVPFYSISGSDFVEMYVGVGASRVRDLFDKAKKSAPCIIFIDEIDAVGRQRGAGLGGGHDEREQTLNQLLVEMDGFIGNQGVIVIAATNRADILDKALLRPGRFDRRVYVGLPDIKGREEILKVHTRNKPLAPDVDLKIIARTTPGFTGADLENLVNEAALLAASRNRMAIVEKDIEDASIKVMAGPEKRSRVISPEARRLTAYHEAGHAVSAYFCKTSDPVHQITIIPHGDAGGFTMYRPEDDVSFVTKTKMAENLISMLGGRVAEKLVLDDISTGASNDLERATSIARAMVTRYGFSDRLGPVVYGTDPQETFLGRDFGSNKHYSEEIASEIDSEIRGLLDDAFTKAEKILSENMDELHLVSETLLERDKITGDEFRILMKGGVLPEFMVEEEEPVKAEKEENAEAEKEENAKAAKEVDEVKKD